MFFWLTSMSCASLIEESGTMFTSSQDAPVTRAALGAKPGVGVPLGAALDFEALDEFVGEEVAGDAGDLFFRQRAVEAVLDGGVYGEAAAVFDAEHERGGIGGRVRPSLSVTPGR